MDEDFKETEDIKESPKIQPQQPNQTPHYSESKSSYLSQSPQQQEPKSPYPSQSPHQPDIKPPYPMHPSQQHNAHDSTNSPAYAMYEKYAQKFQESFPTMLRYP